MPDIESREGFLEDDNRRLRIALGKLWDAVKKYDRIGFEGSELLEVMSEARHILDSPEFRVAKPDELRSISSEDSYTFVCRTCDWTGQEPKTLVFGSHSGTQSRRVCPQCYRLNLGWFDVVRTHVSEITPK